jgi:hypothetical protein
MCPDDGRASKPQRGNKQKLARFPVILWPPPITRIWKNQEFRRKKSNRIYYADDDGRNAQAQGNPEPRERCLVRPSIGNALSVEVRCHPVRQPLVICDGNANHQNGTQNQNNGGERFHFFVEQKRSANGPTNKLWIPLPFIMMATTLSRARSQTSRNAPYHLNLNQSSGVRAA